MTIEPKYLMNWYYSKHLTIVLLCLIVTFNLEAQVALSTFIDIGENNVSEGIYVKSSVLGAYQFGETKITAGSQFNLKSNSTNALAGISINVAQEFTIKEFQFEVAGLFLCNPFSEVMHESNWGVLVNVKRTHFMYKLGTSFRTYRITKKASENYDIESNKSLHENWNLMYLVGCNLKPMDSNWNLGVTLTNIDHFLINQETNPMVYLRGTYDVKSSLRLYMETWCKSAGSLNISANNFGFFFRTGVKWNLDLKK